MTSMSRSTGRQISQAESIKQAVADILTTPVGSRVHRRDYGSLIPRLIDMPISSGLPLQVASAAFHALLKFEPRLMVSRVAFVEIGMDGRAAIEIEGSTRAGEQITISQTLT